MRTQAPSVNTARSGFFSHISGFFSHESGSKSHVSGFFSHVLHTQVVDLFNKYPYFAAVNLLNVLKNFKEEGLGVPASVDNSNGRKMIL